MKTFSLHRKPALPSPANGAGRTSRYRNESKPFMIATTSLFLVLLPVSFFSCKKISENPPPLQIISVTPKSAPAEALVVVDGRGFSKEESANLLQFNGRDAFILTSSETRIVAKVPRRAGVGPVSITVGGKTAFGPIFNLIHAQERP